MPKPTGSFLPHPATPAFRLHRLLGDPGGPLGLTTSLATMAMSLVLAGSLAAQPGPSFEVDASVASVLQDDDLDGNADFIFGTGGVGVFTQHNKPTQTFFVEDQAAIRFDLSGLLGLDILDVRLQLLQATSFRGLQSGTLDVLTSNDDGGAELDDFNQGTFADTLSAPGTVGALVEVDLTDEVVNALTVFGPGADHLLVLLRNPITSDATGNPYSITFSSDVHGAGEMPKLLVCAQPANTPPTADAGPDQSVRAGDTVLLDGSASFDDNTATPSLVYAWTFSSRPVGSTATLTGANTATPSFVADLPGAYTVQLIVTDEGALASSPDEVTVSSNNLAPMAVAGDDQLILLGTVVSLDGSASSDPELDPLTFAWTLTSAPAGSTAALSGATTPSPQLQPDLEGIYIVTLNVSDLIGPGTPDTVQITASSATGFAEFKIMSAAAVVSGLGSGQVTTSGNRNALLNFLSQALGAIQQGELAKAIDKLQKAIDRTDGCVLRGAPDGNGPGRDWVLDCAAQAVIYDCLEQALLAISP